jgi:hypothetical protein
LFFQKFFCFELSQNQTKQIPKKGRVIHHVQRESFSAFLAPNEYNALQKKKAESERTFSEIMFSPTAFQTPTLQKPKLQTNVKLWE